MAKAMRKIRVGSVVSARMDKTVVVELVWKQRHRVYRKQMRRVTRFYVHDPNGRCEIGDTVRIQETRPYRAPSAGGCWTSSRGGKWRMCGPLTWKATWFLSRIRRTAPISARMTPILSFRRRRAPMRPTPAPEPAPGTAGREGV